MVSIRKRLVAFHPSLLDEMIRKKKKTGKMRIEKKKKTKSEYSNEGRYPGRLYDKESPL